MPMPRNLASYLDVQRVLDTALQHGGLRYKLKSPGAARHWRQRAYTFRRLKQDQAEQTVGDLPGAQPSTPYDQLLLRLEENTVLIGFHEPIGELYAPDGTRVEPTTSQPTTYSGEDSDLIEQFKGLVDPDEE